MGNSNSRSEVRIEATTSENCKKALRAQSLELDEQWVIDWDGCKLNNKILKDLEPGDCVRVELVKSNFSKPTPRSFLNQPALYFEIVRIRNGTFWGRSTHSSEVSNCRSIRCGDIMTFRQENICEIPICWSTVGSRHKKKLNKYREPERGTVVCRSPCKFFRKAATA